MRIQTFDEGSMPSSNGESYTERYGKQPYHFQELFKNDQSMYTKKQNEDEIRFIICLKNKGINFEQTAKF